MTGQIHDTGQLDLFLHSRAVVLANEVIEALLARDAVRAAEGLDSLLAEQPGHCGRKALETLCAVLREWPFLPGGPAGIAAAIRRLEADAHPAARAAMGEKAADFMRPLWRELARDACAHAYDPAFAQSYSAPLYLRCGDAEAALAAAQAIAHHDDNVDALHWLAVARHRIDGLDASRTPIMRLALIGPERLPTVLSEIDDPLLSRDWHAFHGACHWLDPQDEATAAWFPAWHLVEYPGIRIDLGASAALPATRAAQAFVELARLLGLEKQGYSSALVSARRRLRELDSDLFDLYMARRNVSRR